MRAALENCGEFLCRIGALEGANAIAEVLRKSGWELPETSSFRWRALVAAIHQELDADPMDVTFLFERLLQLDAMKPSKPSRALFGSPLFLHLLVKRFAVAFEGLDAELFKLESDELCHAEGIYETCLLIRDRLEENNTESELKKFLAAFEMIFKLDEPKECWDALYDLYHLNDASFRRDMKRALSVIESATLGPTKLERDSQTELVEDPKIVIPRAQLEKRFGGTRREWRDLSQINSIPGPDVTQAEQEHQEQEQREPAGNTAVEAPRVPVESPGAQDWGWSNVTLSFLCSYVTLFSFHGAGNDDDTESLHSDISEERSLVQWPTSSRPPRAAEAARADRQEVRHAVPRRRVGFVFYYCLQLVYFTSFYCTQTPRDEDGGGVISGGSTVERQGGRRPRMRWSAEEVAALVEGYQLYKSYSNVWMLIKNRFPDVLQRRSNVDLKDKYRNLVRYGRIPPANGDGTDTGATDNDATDDNGEEIV
ncbi:hypothetical protein V7S43_011396 [Phytophthora oleae]|uniref:Myb-like domain-containing protein n=1 Tax=Phytophthora oleae TaxID=2107226 RepID=A0ABD3F9V2_9STRA